MTSSNAHDRTAVVQRAPHSRDVDLPVEELGNTLCFGNCETSSLGGSDREHSNSNLDPYRLNDEKLKGSFDQSMSSFAELFNDPNGSQKSNSSLIKRTSSLTTASIEGNEEKENACSDTLDDDIQYLRQKASILQRASHILLHKQRDYHKIVSYNAWIEEKLLDSTNKISIWDEAKYFLLNESDSPEDILRAATTIPSASANHATTPAMEQPEIYNVTASMKSISAVQQYCASNRSDPAIAAAKYRLVATSTPRRLIDTSLVQNVTSTQYDTNVTENVALNDPLKTSTTPFYSANSNVTMMVDRWYSQTTSCPHDSSRRKCSTNEKKRKYLNTLSNHRTISNVPSFKKNRGESSTPLNIDMGLTFNGKGNDLQRRRRNKKVKTSVLPLHHLLSTLSSLTSNHHHEKRNVMKLLTQATTRN